MRVNRLGQSYELNSYHMSKSAVFLEYRDDYKCDIDFMQQFFKPEV